MSVSTRQPNRGSACAAVDKKNNNICDKIKLNSFDTWAFGRSFQRPSLVIAAVEAVLGLQCFLRPSAL